MKKHSKTMTEVKPELPVTEKEQTMAEVKPELPVTEQEQDEAEAKPELPVTLQEQDEAEASETLVQSPIMELDELLKAQHLIQQQIEEVKQSRKANALRVVKAMIAEHELTVKDLFNIELPKKLSTYKPANVGFKCFVTGEPYTGKGQISTKNAVVAAIAAGKSVLVAQAPKTPFHALVKTNQIRTQFGLEELTMEDYKAFNGE